jgi:DNA helicase HerA-like ATPase
MSIAASESADQEPKITWRRVGTVVGNASTSDFTFILRQFQASVGDIVALGMEVPGSGYTSRNRIYVWARVTDIQRFNPFFPYEAAQEIAGEGISLEDTVLSGTRDQLQATALILGATTEDNLSALFPLTYHVKPAAQVFHPPADAVRKLLIGGLESERSVLIGNLIARNDVDVTLSAPKLVARHLAILAMTGGGKTVAARRIIRELIREGYPLLVLDPHGDYIGLSKCQELFDKEAPGSEIRIFYPDLLMQTDGETLIEKLIGQMTDGLSEPQSDYIRSVFSTLRARQGEPALDYIERLVRQVEANIAAPQGQRVPTMYAVRRSLRIVHGRLAGMRKTSQMMRQSPKLRGLRFEPLPNPFSQPEKIIKPGQTSVLYLGGYDHITQCSIAAITLETLFEFRANLTSRIAPFFTVIEEAHTFIPSAREGTTEDAVSLPVIRRIITEGRKFGTGLMLISQRPSRIDETIISQCNSFLILRLVNPRDQTFVRSIMENLTESDARMTPGFGPGQGIVSGQVVRFPRPVRIKMDTELLRSEIGDEDFFEQVEDWEPDADTETRRQMEESMGRVDASRGRGGSDDKPRHGKRGRGHKRKK